MRRLHNQAVTRAELTDGTQTPRISLDASFLLAGASGTTSPSPTAPPPDGCEGEGEKRGGLNEESIKNNSQSQQPIATAATTAASVITAVGAASGASALACAPGTPQRPRSGRRFQLCRGPNPPRDATPAFEPPRWGAAQPNDHDAPEQQQRQQQWRQHVA